MKLIGKGIYVYTDPAAENSILAIVDELIFSGKVCKKDFLVYSNVIRKSKTNSKDLVEIVDFSLSDIKNVLSSFKPQYIFCGTSPLNKFEHLWRKVAVNENIKVISFIDHWTSYIERFTFNNEIIFGDEVWVVNKIAKKEAVLAGIPEKIINILGNPYYEKVKKFKPIIDKKLFFKSNNLNPTKSIVLYISDYLSTNYAKNIDGLCELGYDEYTVFLDLLDCLNSYDNNFISKFQFLIKIHPKAPMNKFNSILKKYNIKNLDIITLRDCDSLTVNYYSDYIIGMHSNMVIESFLLDKRLLRVQTGQLFQDLIKLSPLNNNVIINKNKLKNKLFKFLNN